MIQASALHGTVVINDNGTLTYTPDANYNGPDTISYTANDGTVDSNVATVNLTVNPVNDAPVISFGGPTSSVTVQSDASTLGAATGRLGVSPGRIGVVEKHSERMAS